MSNVPYSPPPRHALGLPAGSVRALLALSVLGLLWLLALRPLPGEGVALGAVQLPTVFMDLQILMVTTIHMDTMSLCFCRSATPPDWQGRQFP